MSNRPFAWKNEAHTGQIFIKLDTWAFFEKLRRIAITGTARSESRYALTQDVGSDNYILYIIYFFLALQSSTDYGLLVHEVFVITHNDAPQSVGLLRTSDQLVAETCTWQHTQQTNIHVPGRIQNQARSRGAAVDLRLRPRGHWDRHHWRTQGGGLGGSNPTPPHPTRNSEVLKKLGQIPSSVEYTSVTT
jgi:hypothetical protein